MTIAGEPVFRTPIPGAASGALASASIELRDLSGTDVVLIQGDARSALDSRWSRIPTEPGDVLDVESTLLCRLTARDLYLTARTPSVRLPSIQELNSSFERTRCSARATDYRHGTAVVNLRGSAAPHVLSKVCGLDFSEAAFPDMQVRQTGAAKIETLIVRCDEDAVRVYYLHVHRPFGQYMWDTVGDAALEFLEKEQT